MRVTDKFILRNRGKEGWKEEKEEERRKGGKRKKKEGGRESGRRKFHVNVAILFPILDT